PAAASDAARNPCHLNDIVPSERVFKIPNLAVGIAHSRSSLGNWRDHAVRIFVLSRRGDTQFLDQGGGRGRAHQARQGHRQACGPRQARPRGSPDAEDGGDNRAHGPRSRRPRRSVRRDQGSTARLLSDRLRFARRGHRHRQRHRARREGRLRNPAGETVSAPRQSFVSDVAWIDSVLRSARPQVVGALVRYFRSLDQAEEAFQEACLRALKNWPVDGPPRRSKSTSLPADDQISDLGDAEADIAERLDNSHYRDDVLRLLFICCHPDLPAVQQIALALRIVSGLSVKEIARAFLVGESAMEQRITRAKSRVARADVPFETSGAVE